MTLRNKVLTMVLAGILGINTVAPTLDSGVLGTEALSQAWETQSTLLSYSSFSVLPLKMIDQMFLNETTGTAGMKTHKKSGSKKKDDKRSSPSFITSEERNIFNKRINISANSCFVMPMHAVHILCPQRSPAPPVTNTFMSVFILMFMIFLPRRKIEDSILTNKIYRLV